MISLQGILGPCSEKYFSGIPKAVATRYEKLSSKIIFDSAYTKSRNIKARALREKKILRSAKYIIGRTDWDRNVSTILAPDSIYYQLNEILRDVFYDHEWQKTTFDRKIKIVTITGDDLYKGFETIVKTAALLTSCKDLDFEWNVIGVDKKSEIVSIVRKWLKADMEKININLLGQKNKTEVAKLIFDSTIYCQVSHIENSSNSLCEAMLIGKPIVATYAGGTSSLLENMKEGLLVQEGEYYSIAGAIKEFKANPELANELCKKCQSQSS